MTRALSIRIRGQVQGVGFRPFVWRLAQDCGVAGQVSNDAAGVLVHAEGGELDRFLAALSGDAPVAAVIDGIEAAPAAPRGAAGFRIAASGAGAAETRIAPDLALCDDCRAEVEAPGRRHGYSFTNCTNCGPRFSIIESVPYDRSATTMQGFTLCPDCAAEYHDPADRRFHAQPIACPACGPRLSAPLAEAAAVLAAGGIIALKGLGGFHLACDATSEAAVAALRARKGRPTKPLAVMAPLEAIRAATDATPEEIAVLAGPAAPILLLAGSRGLAAGIAPGLDRVGWMRPTTPLHHLLARAVAGRPLVMTSANPSGRPMLTTADPALATLADLVLDHDRPIARRIEDSVGRITAGRLRLHRRARGYAPQPVRLHPGFAAAPPGLAFGGHLKAAPCLIRGREAVLSQHLGDLDDPETVAACEAARADLLRLMDHQPAWAACDLHPGYRTTALAEATGLPLHRIAHHHAHLAATMAEAGLPPDAGPVSGVILDGLGLGPDGALRGGEVWLGGFAEARIVGGLKPVALPGGDAASRAPWRNLLAHLDAAGMPEAADALLPGKPLALLRRAVASGVNAPACSSAGRLFDAMACLLGVAPDLLTHEAEAAMRLEALARTGTPGPGLRFSINPPGVVDPAPMWKESFHLLGAGTQAADIAWRFHRGVAEAFSALARRTRAATVALGGGCFHNALLLEQFLEVTPDLMVLTPAEVPAGDGGLALGQAAIASARSLTNGVR